MVRPLRATRPHFVVVPAVEMLSRSAQPFGQRRPAKHVRGDRRRHRRTEPTRHRHVAQLELAADHRESGLARLHATFSSVRRASSGVKLATTSRSHPRRKPLGAQHRLVERIAADAAIQHPATEHALQVGRPASRRLPPRPGEGRAGHQHRVAVTNEAPPTSCETRRHRHCSPGDCSWTVTSSPAAHRRHSYRSRAVLGDAHVLASEVRPMHRSPAGPCGPAGIPTRETVAKTIPKLRPGRHAPPARPSHDPRSFPPPLLLQTNSIEDQITIYLGHGKEPTLPWWSWTWPVLVLAVVLGPRGPIAAAARPPADRHGLCRRLSRRGRSASGRRAVRHAAACHRRHHHRSGADRLDDDQDARQRGVGPRHGVRRRHDRVQRHRRVMSAGRRRAPSRGRVSRSRARVPRSWCSGRLPGCRWSFSLVAAGRPGQDADANPLQTSLNLALGTAPASSGLAIPAVPAVAIILGERL